MPHMGGTSKTKKKVRYVGFVLNGSSHQTGDVAFTPATPQDLQYSKAYTVPQNSHTTQRKELKQKKLFKKKGI
jgi:hypothetical protein